MNWATKGKLIDILEVFGVSYCYDHMSIAVISRLGGGMHLDNYGHCWFKRLSDHCKLEMALTEDQQTQGCVSRMCLVAEAVGKEQIMLSVGEHSIYTIRATPMNDIILVLITHAIHNKHKISSSST